MNGIILVCGAFSVPHGAVLFRYAWHVQRRR